MRKQHQQQLLGINLQCIILIIHNHNLYIIIAICVAHWPRGEKIIFYVLPSVKVILHVWEYLSSILSTSWALVSLCLLALANRIDLCLVATEHDEYHLMMFI